VVYVVFDYKTIYFFVVGSKGCCSSFTSRL